MSSSSQFGWHYFIYNTAVFIILYCVGNLIFSFLNFEHRNCFELSFKKLTVGLVSCTIFYTLCATNFNTISLGLIPPTFFVIWQRKNEIKFSYKNLFSFELQPVLVFFGALVMFQLFFYFRNNTGNFEPRLEFLDEPFYAGIADYIKSYGIETDTLNSVDIRLQGPSLYNYFNIWITSFFSWVFSIPSLIVYKYIVFTILFAIAYLGTVCIALRIYSENIFYSALVSVLIFLVVGFGVPVSNLLDQPYYWILWDHSILLKHISKLIIGLILIEVAFINYKGIVNIKVVFPLLILATVYISFIPSVYGGILFYLSYQFIHKNKIDKQILFLSISSIATISIFYFFNNLLSPKVSHQFHYSNFDLFKDFTHTEFFKIKTYVVVFYGYVKSFFISSSLYILLFALSLKRFDFYGKFDCNILAFIAGYVTCGFATFLIFMHSYDGHQFFSNSATVVYILLLFFIVSAALKNIKLIELPVVLMIVLFSFYNFYMNFVAGKDLNRKNYKSEEARNILFSEFGCKISYTTAFINNPIDKDEGQLMFNNSINIPFPEIRNCNSNYFPISLSVFNNQFFDNLAQKDAFLRTRVNSAFFNYVVENKMNDDIDKATYCFLHDYQIDYLFIQKEHLDFEKWKNRLPVQTEISFTEESYSIFKLNWVAGHNKNNF